MKYDDGVEPRARRLLSRLSPRSGVAVLSRSSKLRIVPEVSVVDPDGDGFVAIAFAHNYVVASLFFVAIRR